MTTSRTPPNSLNLNLRGMRSSATVAINEKSDQLRREGRAILKLGLGQSPFPVPEQVVQALRDNAHQKDYLPVRGLQELRDAVADYHRRTNGLDDRTGADVLVGPGSKELMFLLQLSYYGELVIPAPSWVSYAPQARIIGRRVSHLPTDRAHGYNLSAQVFEDMCKQDQDTPRIIILNYPNNPTGATYTESELRELADVARRHGVLVLSDEIYGPLHHEGKHTSIARFYPEGTILSGGLSKWCGAGGWRLGTFLFPPSLRWLLDAMAVAASETFTSTSAPIQYAAVTAYTHRDELAGYLGNSRRILKALGGWLSAALRQAGIDCDTPAGGFYMFADFAAMRDELAGRGIVTGEALCHRLLEDTGVAVLPGSDFGLGRDSLTIRLAYVDFDGGAALDAVAGLPAGQLPDETFLRTHCKNVVDAIERIAAWTTGS